MTMVIVCLVVMSTSHLLPTVDAHRVDTSSNLGGGLGGGGGGGGGGGVAAIVATAVNNDDDPMTNDTCGFCCQVRSISR